MMWCIENKIFWFVRKSFTLLRAIHYIIKNARNKKNFINYVFNIVLNEKHVNIIIIDII